MKKNIYAYIYMHTHSHIYMYVYICIYVLAGIYNFSQKRYTKVENGFEDTGRRKGKLGQSERVSWTYIHYQM